MSENKDALLDAVLDRMCLNIFHKRGATHCNDCDKRTPSVDFLISQYHAKEAALAAMKKDPNDACEECLLKRDSMAEKLEKAQAELAILKNGGCLCPQHNDPELKDAHFLACPKALLLLDAARAARCRELTDELAQARKDLEYWKTGANANGALAKAFKDQLAKANQHGYELGFDDGAGKLAMVEAELARTQAQVIAEHDLYLSAHRANIEGAGLLMKARERDEALRGQVERLAQFHVPTDHEHELGSIDPDGECWVCQLQEIPTPAKIEGADRP